MSGADTTKAAGPNSPGSTDQARSASSDPTRCDECGKLWLTADAEWRVCMDCPNKDVIDIPGLDNEAVDIHINLEAFIRFLQAIQNQLR